MFKVYEGTYVELLHTLKPLQLLRDQVLKSQTKDDYLRAINLDLNRIRYFTDHTSLDQMQQRLRETAHLVDATGELKDPERYFAYSQGDFFAGMFSELLVTLTVESHKSQELGVPQGDELSNYSGTIKLVYINDDNVNCGISITHFRKRDPETGEPYNSKVPFVVSIIKNTNGALVDRKITSFIHSDILSLTPACDIDQVADVAHAKEHDVTETDLLGEINKAINSKKLSKFLQGLIDGESVSIERFKEISLEIERNCSVQTLYPLLEGAYFSAEQAESFNLIHNEYCNQRTAASTTYEKDKLALHHHDLDNALTQSVFRRNFGKIAIGSIGLLVAVGVIVAAPWVLAVVGSIMLLGGLVAGGIFAAWFSAFKSILNEVQLKDYKSKLSAGLSSLENAYQKKCNSIEADYEQKKSALADEIAANPSSTRDEDDSGVDQQFLSASSSLDELDNPPEDLSRTFHAIRSLPSSDVPVKTSPICVEIEEYKTELKSDVHNI